MDFSLGFAADFFWTRTILLACRAYSSITVMLVFIEFCSLSVYALGGAILKKFLQTHLRLLEIFTAVIICGIGVLMMFR